MYLLKFNSYYSFNNDLYEMQRDMALQVLMAVPTLVYVSIVSLWHLNFYLKSWIFNHFDKL